MSARSANTTVSISCPGPPSPRRWGTRVQAEPAGSGRTVTADGGGVDQTLAAALTRVIVSGLGPYREGSFSVEVPCASASSSVGSLPLARRRWLAMTDSATSTILRLVRRA
jgi:hypothetical protein